MREVVAVAARGEAKSVARRGKFVSCSYKFCSEYLTDRVVSPLNLNLNATVSCHQIWRVQKAPHTNCDGQC